MQNEHTRYSVSQTSGDWTCSEWFDTEAEALEHMRDLLAVGLCVKISLDKYTPSEDELRDMEEMERGFVETNNEAHLARLP